MNEDLKSFLNFRDEFVELRAKVESEIKSKEKAICRIHERIDINDSKVSSIVAKLDDLLLNINRVKYIGIGAVIFYVLDKFGGIGALKMALGFILW